MRPTGYLGMVLVLVGAVLTVAGILSGEMKLGLVLFFIPFIEGGSLLALMAVGCIILGLFLTFLSWTAPATVDNAPGTDLSQNNENSAQATKGRSRFGGVVLIGPIPIIIGSDRRMALWGAILAALLLTVLALLLFLR